MNKEKRKDLFEAEIRKAQQMPEAYDKRDFISENKQKLTIGGKYK